MAEHVAHVEDMINAKKTVVENLQQREDFENLGIVGRAELHLLGSG
jgi:hypothetical protein